MISTVGDPERAMNSCDDELTPTVEGKEAKACAPEQQGRLNRLHYLAALGQWTPIVAHEMGQPLAAILNYVEGAKRAFVEVAQANPRFAEFLDEIERLTRREAEMVKLLRDYERRNAPRPSAVDVNEVIRDALGLLANIDQETGQPSVASDVGLGAGLPLALVDPTALFQVLVSLLLNATAQSAYVPASLQVRSLINDSGELEIQLHHDSGYDPSHATADSLTLRSKPSRSDAARPHGLYVSECRSIVESQGGRLSWRMLSTGFTLIHIILPGASGE